jgi:TonB-dependent receptor
MRSGLRVVCSAGVSLVITLLLVSGLSAQQGAGSITGKVTDPSQGVLQGARIELQPGRQSTQSDANGEFTIKDVNPGRYTVTVSHEGFGLYSTDVTVSASSSARVDAILQVGTHNEIVTVTGEREGGEIEALTIERTADNIVQVLPADVITSLPNTNIADAIGRMPSVSLERDEGEGKYIQIRGTEPRLSNVTINGIHMPSPEGVRNVKLDVIPADLVSSVEINKTLSANQDADAIGGSVNLVTRTPADQPYVTLLGMGGYTPITGGRHLYQFAGTAGQRFGHDKKFGALFGFSYDYNSRGINDVEPGPAINPLPNGNNFLGPNAEDLRNYHYDRSRYGFDGDLDYKLGDWSTVYIRGLFSHFDDFGEDWIYSPGISNFVSSVSDANNTCGITDVTGVQGCGGMSFTNVYRHPSQQIVSVQAGARHVFGGTVLNYEAALSQAAYTGGFGFARFNGPGSGWQTNGNNDVAFGVNTTDPFVPKFPVLNGKNIYDTSSYFPLFADNEFDGITERDAVGDISLSKPYKVGGHFSTFEVGFKGWDARKVSVVNRVSYCAATAPPSNITLPSSCNTNVSPTTFPLSNYLGTYRDNHYYFGQYQFGPTTKYKLLDAAFQPYGLTPETGYNLPNDFDIGERIWAGYAMDTIDLGKFRLQGGVRVESTADSLRANTIVADPGNGNFADSASPLSSDHSYINAFPSVQAQYRFTSDTVLRAAYGAGIARANFSSLAPFISFTPGQSVPYSRGNPNLKPTHAQNFDLLAEHYFSTVGIIQAGVFYKSLTDPIYPITGTYNGQASSDLSNGPSAHLLGFEATWQQPLKFLPGPLNGMGVRANYGYTTSRATFPAGGRTDHPTLVRTAPNNWNFDVTYDKKGFSARMGLTHNDAYIWFYGGDNSKTPSGDTYLYPHTQVDAQVSYWIPRGHGLQAVVSLLNLNNEVFGFYNGAEQYPIQREYYSRTVSAGLRWTLHGRETP